MALQADFCEHWKNKGHNFLAIQRTFCAAVLAAAILAGCSRDPEVQKKKHFDRGVSYFQAGKYREAAIEYQNAIQIDPKYAQAHYELAQCFLKRSEWSLAYQELMRTVTLDASNAKAQLDLGSILLAGGKYREAGERAQTLLAVDPHNATAEMLLADSDAGQGDLKKALEEAKLAVQMDPQRTTSYVNLALIQEKNKDLASAEKSLQTALTTDQKSLAAMLALANLYQHQGRWPEAEKQYQNAIATEPKNAVTRAGLALLLLHENKKDAAEQTLKDAKAAMPDNPAAYRMLGDFYVGQRQPEKAFAEFSSLHTAHPKDAAVSKTYAQLLIDSNRLDEAEQITVALLKDSPSDADALILRGEVQERQGKPSEAVVPLEKAVKAAPNNAVGHYYLGVAYATSTNIGQAESEWREAARLEPRMIEPQRALAMAAAQQRDMKTLGEASQKWIDLDPKAADAYLYRSRTLLAKKDFAGAEADLKKSIDLAPQSAVGYARLADLRVLEKRYDEADKLYTQALNLNPSATDALTGLVNMDLFRKQPAEAVEQVQNQIAKVPNRSDFYVLLGLAQRQNQNLAKAEEALQKAVDLDNKNVTAVTLLADVQLARHMVDDAILTYQRAIANNPPTARLFTSLGSLFENKGQWEQAEDNYKKALDLKADDPQAANNLAFLMLEHGGDANAALKLAQTGRRGLPNLPNTADTLGWAYYKFGAYDSAIDALKDAVKGNPKSPEYHYHLGMAYKASGNLPAARQELQQTLKISPKYSAAAEIRAALADIAKETGTSD